MPLWGRMGWGLRFWAFFRNLYAEPWVFKKMDNAQKEQGIVLNQFASIYEKVADFKKVQPLLF